VKVYGWLDFVNGIQVRVIVAAKSKAECARIVGDSRGPRNLFNLDETGNAREIEVATAEPGTAFYAEAASPRQSADWRPLVRGRSGS
jgi:hypothetical protein